MEWPPHRRKPTPQPGVVLSPGTTAIGGDGVGAENPVMSCDVQVLVHQAAEPVSS